MTISAYTAMQKAVDIVNTSPHPTSKVSAALVAGTDIFARTNNWPTPILQTLGQDTRIGNSSGTVHAEVSCILAASQNYISTDGASLFITDPFCPNCAKNIAESGVKNIYIDHKGFTKDFAQRRGDEFESMSMRIAERAGISVFEIWRKEEKIIPLITPLPGYTPPQDYPVEILLQDDRKSAKDAFDQFVSIRKFIQLHDRYACAYATNKSGQGFLMYAKTHPAIGYSAEKDIDICQQKEGKYSFVLEPINRLLMASARHGLKISDGLLYSAIVPTSREQVNFIAAGLTRMMIGQTDQARDDDSIAAQQLLEKHRLIHFTPVK